MTWFPDEVDKDDRYTTVISRCGKVSWLRMIMAGCKKGWHEICKWKELVSATLSGRTVNFTSGETVNYEPMHEK